jgi:predicted nucleic acid-binding protein
MFILDTNVLSEIMRVGRVPEVAAWMDGQDEDLLFTTSISQAEIFSGLAVMADGRRRRDLEKTALEMFAEFEGHVLPFDTDAAIAYADLYAVRRKVGRPVAPLDLMIASIARSQGATMVTRNIGDFEDCGVTLINPWEEA